MPALAEPIAASPAGSKLDTIRNLFETTLQDGLKNGVPDSKAPAPIEATPKPEPEKAKAAPADADKPSVDADKPGADPKKPAAKPDPKATDKVDVAKGAEKPASSDDDKKRFKVGELSDDEKPLLHSQQRVIDAKRAADKRIGDLEAELAPLKAKLAEVEGRVSTAPKEIETLRAENERLKAENSDYSGKVMAYDVSQTREYQMGVDEPWKRDVVGVLKELSAVKRPDGTMVATGFDGDAAYRAIQTGNKAALNALSATLTNDLDKQALAEAFRAGKALLAKHEEYSAKSGDALKAIKERQTTAERQASEQAKAEVGRIGSSLSKQVSLRFPFLNGIEGDQDLNGALKKAQEDMEKFDVVNASPQERAEAAHARAFAPIIATRLERIIQGQHGEIERLKAEHQKVETELREQIASFEERVGNLNGETVVAQPGKRDAQGRFQQKVDSTSLFKTLMAGKG